MTADSGTNARAARQRPPASDEFPALGAPAPQQSELGALLDRPDRPAMHEGSGSQRPAGGWAQLLQRPAAGAVSASEVAAPSGTDVPQMSTGGGRADAGDAAGAVPARARKAAAAEQLQTEARRSVGDAMTGA